MEVCGDERRKRPMTRAKARDLRSLQDRMGEAFLPDEIWARVLCQLSMAELLPLRLVSRRWRDLVFSRLVWQHRSLKHRGGEFNGILEEVGDCCSEVGVAILRMLPALDTLDLWSENHLWEMYSRRAALKDLAQGRCQLRALCLRVDRLTRGAVFNVLNQRRHSLEELRIHFQNMHSYDRVMKALDSFSKLQSLGMKEYLSNSHEFKALNSLQSLQMKRKWTYGDVKNTDLVLQSLLALNRAGLCELDCDMELTAEELQQVAGCTALQELRIVVASSKDLEQLEKLPQLRKLTIRCTQPPHLSRLADLKDFMARSRLRLQLNVEVSEFNNAWPLPYGDLLAPSWSQVHRLKLIKCYIPHNTLFQLLRDTVVLEELVLVNPFQIGEPYAFLRNWTPDMAPAMTSLKIKASVRTPAFCEAAEEIRLMRPGLNVEHDP